MAESQLENNTRMVERAVMAKPATAPALPANDSVLAATLHPKKAITLVAKTKMEPAEEAKTMLNVAVTDVNPKTKRATKVKKPSITAESGSGTMIDESLSAGEESPVITQTAPTKSRSAPKKKRVIVGTEKDAVRAELVDATDKASKRKSTRAVKAVVYNVDAVDDDDTVSNVETSNKAVAHGMDKTHPLENDSPNKPAENERVLSLAQVKKKRRLLEDAPMSVASKSAEPLPLALPSLSTKVLRTGVRGTLSHYFVVMLTCTPVTAAAHEEAGCTEQDPGRH